MNLLRSNISGRTNVSRETFGSQAHATRSRKRSNRAHGALACDVHAPDNREACAPGGRERGASILIALFYFLLCAMIGSVVLTAATVVTGQLVALEKSQQAYYSTTSAAELFRDAIVTGTCASSTDENENALWTCTLPVAEKGSTTPSIGTSNGSDKTLSDQLAYATAYIATQLAGIVPGAPSPSKTLNIELAFSTGGATSADNNTGVLPVTAKLTMRADYSLHITLTPTNYSEQIGNYQVTCDIPAALLYSEDGKKVERITWDNAIISKPSTTTATTATTTTGGN